MSANTNGWARSMGDGSLAILVKLLGDVTQLIAASKRSLPVVLVHGEILHFLEVDDELAIFTTQAYSC